MQEISLCTSAGWKKGIIAFSVMYYGLWRILVMVMKVIIKPPLIPGENSQMIVEFIDLKK